MSTATIEPKEKKGAKRGRAARPAADVPNGGFPNVEAARKAYDPTVHRSLKKGDFADPADWAQFRADELEKEVRELRKEEKMLRTLGSAEARAKFAKAQKMQRELEKLSATLKEQGYDVAEFLDGK